MGSFTLPDARRRKFRELLACPGVTHVPGAHDSLTARLIESKGFEVVYMSGAGTVNAPYIADALDRMMTRDEFYRLVRYDDYHRIEADYLPKE